jgi:hypothetical protein
MRLRHLALVDADVAMIVEDGFQGLVGVAPGIIFDYFADIDVLDRAILPLRLLKWPMISTEVPYDLHYDVSR